MSRDVADSAIVIFRIVDSNVSSKFSTFHSNVSDFLAVVAKDGTGPNAIGHIVSCSLTVIAKTRVGHRLGSVKPSDVLRYYSGGQEVNIDRVFLSPLLWFERLGRGRRGVVGAFVVVGIRWVFSQVCHHELFKLVRRRRSGSDWKNLNGLRQIRR